MERAAWWPRAIGSVVFAAAMVVALLPGGRSDSATDGGRAATLPGEIAGYSQLTGDVSSSPPGRAIALFQHGLGVEFMDHPQAVMLGADGDVYRRVDAAENRSVLEDQGDPAPMLLSPDGTRVAVGSHDPSEPDLAVLDLRTGDTETYPVPGGHALLPLAWSPDSNQVAYLSTATPSNAYSGWTTPTGNVGLLDTASGQGRILPGAANVRTAAFSPEGTELAVARLGPGGTPAAQPAGAESVEIVGLDGAARRQLSLPLGHYLAGPNAWSPDGRLLATVRQGTACAADVAWRSPEWLRCAEQTDGITFLDASGQGRQVPTPLKVIQVGSADVLGWTGADEMMILDDISRLVGPDSDSAMSWVTAMPLNGQQPRRLTAVQGKDDSFAIARFHLASGLLSDLRVRPADEIDRGRLPTWMRASAAVLCGGAALMASKLLLRRTRRVSPSDRAVSAAPGSL